MPAAHLAGYRDPGCSPSQDKEIRPRIDCLDTDLDLCSVGIRVLNNQSVAAFPFQRALLPSHALSYL